MSESLKRTCLFLGLFALMTLGGIAALTVPAVDKAFTQPFTRALVVICAVAMRLFGAHVQANGLVLSFSQGPGAVMVASGCNGVEVSLMFAAAVLAFPTRIKARLIGAVAGVASIQVLNLLRIMSLLLLSRFAQSAFDFFHLYVWDAFIMLDGVMAFLAWYRWQSLRWPVSALPPAAA